MKWSLPFAAAVLACTCAPAAVAQSRTSDPVTEQTPITPPVAEQRAHSYSRFGITVEDPYFWLKDQSYPVVDDPDVLAYLNQENAFFEAQMAPHAELVETLF